MIESLSVVRILEGNEISGLGSPMLFLHISTAGAGMSSCVLSNGCRIFLPYRREMATASENIRLKTRVLAR